LEKSYKIVTALEAPSLNLRWPTAAGGSAPNPPCCYFHLYYYNFVSAFSALNAHYYFRNKRTKL